MAGADWRCLHRLQERKPQDRFLFRHCRLTAQDAAIHEEKPVLICSHLQDKLHQTPNMQPSGAETRARLAIKETQTWTTGRHERIFSVSLRWTILRHVSVCNWRVHVRGSPGRWSQGHLQSNGNIYFCREQRWRIFPWKPRPRARSFIPTWSFVQPATEKVPGEFFSRAQTELLK